MKVLTANGTAEIELVYCEVTGVPLCWASVISAENIAKGSTPAFISLIAIDDDGQQQVDLSDCDTF